MAYDRYDRDNHSRWSDDRSDTRNREHGWDRGPGRDRDHDRGFFERAGDEIASWFGGSDDDRRDRHPRDEHRRERGWSSSRSNRDYDRGYGRDYDRDRSSFERSRSGRDFNEDRGLFNRGGSSERDYNRGWTRNLWGSGDRDRPEYRDEHRGNRGYRPMTGDYGRGRDHESEQFFAASGYGRGERGFGDYERSSGRSGGRDDYDRSETPWGRDEYRRTSFAGSRKDDRDYDPHYHNWRSRHMSELDRDYDDYQREHQSRFENDFGSWREKRQEKRGLLGQIREHMEVIGKDDEHVGTVDKVAGDRIILTKSDAESGGRHHSLSCSDIDRVEDDRVILDCSAKDARERWRDEDRSRALFEREDQGEMGPRTLNRSFEGTYR